MMFLGCLAVSQFLFHLSILNALQDLSGGDDAGVICRYRVELLGAGRGGRRDHLSYSHRCTVGAPAIWIPACASSSPVFLMMYSAYKLNRDLSAGCQGSEQGLWSHEQLLESNPELEIPQLKY